MITQAIILAGGKGERLRPYTLDRPKPMVEILGKPIIAYQVDQLKAIGVTDFVFACSYKREALMDYFGDGSKFGIKILYSEEDQPLGRGGGIKQAMKKLHDWEDIVVMNGDILWQSDFPGLLKKHSDNQAIATIVVSPLRSPYGIVEFNDSDQILGFKEKPILPHWINGGVYIFNHQIQKLLPDVGDHETETFPKLPKEKFLVFKSEAYWRGVDTVKDLTEAEKEVKIIFSPKN